MAASIKATGIPVTIKEALTQSQRLQASSDSWQLDGELLLADALQVTREYLFTSPSESISIESFEDYRAKLARRLAGEPVAYILGRQAFWDFELTVNSHVLIPRPETELLVETAIELLAGCDGAAVSIADLGTGSGAIAIALSGINAHWQLVAVDSCEQALAVAVANASSLARDNIEFSLGSWCDGLGAECFDMIVANPPYVAVGDSHLQQGDLVFEPAAALVAEEGGVADLRAIIEQSRNHLKRDAWLLLEHGFDQQQAVATLLQEAGFANIECQQDYAGLDRLTSAQFSH